MSPHKKHVAFFDQIRGFAIICVFLFHALGISYSQYQLPWGDWFPKFEAPRSFLFFLPLTMGWAGVAVFFVVSGFCIHNSFARNPDWQDFAVRRFFRIYPPYVVALLLFALILPWTRIGHDFFGIALLGSHLALVQNLDDRSFFAINPSFWSIAVEAQLYLIYPVMLLLVKRIGWRKTLLFIGALEIGLRTVAGLTVFSTGDLPLFRFLGMPFLYWFSWAIGAAIADAHLLGHPLPFANHSWRAWSVVAVASGFIKPIAPYSFLFFAVLTATVIVHLLQKDEAPARWPALRKWISNVGLWSFSIYLLHEPFLDLAPRLAAKFPLPHVSQHLEAFGIALLFWFPILGLSALSYRWIELPGIALGKRVSSLVPSGAQVDT